MIPLALDEVRTLCRGRLDAEPWADEIAGVQIDSRRIAEGDLFVAVGRGVDFRRHALARGAAAVLVPDDGFEALGALAGAVRARSKARVVGITGSTGKTSSKDILAALCRPHARTVAAEASFNNELGVPLTLCRLEEDTEICVLELAMRGLGQIASLCAFARPTHGVITNIAPVHLELVGSLENVARAKAELLDALPAGAPAIVPAAAPALEPFLGRADLRVVRVGEGGDVRLERFERRDGGSEVGATVHGERVVLELRLAARHQAENAVTALAAYDALGLPLDGAYVGAADVRISRWRGEELPLPGGGVLVNDSYNANPLAMEAALTDLAERAAGRRVVAVLGEMAELGEEAPRYHREVGEVASRVGVGALVGIGPLAREYLEGARGVPVRRWARTVDEGIHELRAVLADGDCVLVKGSRAVGLEAVAEALALVTA